MPLLYTSRRQLRNSLYCTRNYHPYTGMLIDIPEEDWVVFARANHAELGDLLLNLAAKVDLSEFEKNKRSPIKAPNSKNQFKGKPHMSTAKLLAAATAI
jgi:hypothetical protein